jgi:hypothetical protein
MKLHAFFAKPLGWNWRHALGELAIVVIGILIALAVNDWAQARRDHALEVLYLKRLLADSDDNLAAIQKRIDLHTRRADILARLNASITGGAPPPSDDEISEVLCRWFIQPALPLRRGTYAELVSSGHLALLRDVELRRLLEGAEATHEEVIRLDRFADVFQQVTAPLNAYRQWQIKPNEWDGVGCRFNYEAMRADPAIPSMLAQLFRDQFMNRPSVSANSRPSARCVIVSPRWI